MGGPCLGTSSRSCLPASFVSSALRCVAVGGRVLRRGATRGRSSFVLVGIGVAFPPEIAAARLVHQALARAGRRRKKRAFYAIK